MNSKTHHILGALFILLMINMPLLLKAQSEKTLVRQGNREFTNGQFNEAEINYRKALDKNPISYKAQFNLGDAMYEQENYEKAAEVFSQSNLKGQSNIEKSNTYYNHGNSMLKAGKLDEAIASYKQALRENPSNEEARYNLEYARQKSQDQQQDQNKDDQDKKDQDNKDQDQQDQEQKDQQEQNQDQQEQNQDQQEKQNQQNQDQQQQGEQNEQQSQKISKKDAERMLDALKNNEKKTLEKLKKARKENARVIKSEKDW